MATIEKWIWVDPVKYPDKQTSHTTGNMPFLPDEKYAVAEFKKKYEFDTEVKSVKLRFSGDTAYDLYMNGDFIATGPIYVGGDFLLNEIPRPSHYASNTVIYPNTKTLDFYARVKLNPVTITEYSQTKGGFMLYGEVELADGRIKYVLTDNSWLSRINNRYTNPYEYDGSIELDEYIPSVRVHNIWHAVDSSIPFRSEEKILPIGCNKITVKAGEKLNKILEFDRIYGAFVAFNAKCNGKIEMNIMCYETDDSLDNAIRVKNTNSSGTSEKFVITEDTEYRGLQMHSIGNYAITVENNSQNDAEIEFWAIGTHYPVTVEAKTTTSDKDLDLVFDVCRHTLKYCRQMIHLDSMRHLEPLACTGDYYIETLMTAMSFGDMGLAKADAIKTAELLKYNDARMYHTTYTLIWVRMVWDIYMLTGDVSVLSECQEALTMLMDRFDTYIGDTGLIETPTDYMFIDWLYIDGMSMHHPPKALGQTCTSAYYYLALTNAAKIFAVLGRKRDSEIMAERAVSLKDSINKWLFDEEKGLYFEGLNTPTPEKYVHSRHPANVEKRYYLKNSNILCTCFGICEGEKAQKVIDKIMTEEFISDCQPYFKHFLFEAIYKNGLRDKYTLKLAEEWKAPVKDCPKGLVEGFIAPEPTYYFDHSHAWGGTPLYSVPKALTGIEILEPGYKKISFSPSSLGLDEAKVEIPTPYGMIVCEISKDGFKYTTPDEITVEIK